jgi:hypothetical protein
MRASSIAFGLVLAVGCGKQEAPASQPHVEIAPQGEDPIEVPTQPTPAFVPSEQGGCTRAYRLLEGTCVHRLYEASNDSSLSAAIAAYKRGVAPPMLGPVLLTRTPKPAAPEKPDPGSLMRKSAKGADAGSMKEQRLAELDAMLALAREKLAKRDEEAKAKRVENAPRTAHSAGANGNDREALNRFAESMGNAPGATGPTRAGDPETARMSELSRIAGQLSGEQLQALTAELGKTGFNTGELEALLSEAREEPSKR